MQLFVDQYNALLNNQRLFPERSLFQSINWHDRIIAIKGARGSGKTSCLLQYARKYYPKGRSCLYVNMNNLYFANHSLISFIDEFYKKGGKVLLLDQINKYHNWPGELNQAYEAYPDLQIVCAGSSLLRFDKPAELAGRVKVYELQGLSFREMINTQVKKRYSRYTLEDVLHNHTHIVPEILKDLRPLAYFADYLEAGYYPFALDKKANYSQKLLKFINLMLEVDITYINQIEIKYIHKLRKLLYLLALNAPLQPNVSKLSNEVEVSRATIMNYLKYLKDAGLINLLYAPNGAAMKKPDQVYLQNPNLIYTIAPGNASEFHLQKTFFYSQLQVGHKVESTPDGDFLVDGKYIFRVGREAAPNEPDNTEVFYARDMIEVGHGNEIPLWLFGFLY